MKHETRFELLSASWPSVTPMNCSLIAHSSPSRWQRETKARNDAGLRFGGGTTRHRARPHGPIRPLIDDIEGDEMRQNKTSKKVISPSKERVIEGLVGGLSITTAADANGVSRQNVHRWLREDYEFQAQLNATRTDLRNETEARLFALAAEAIGALENALQRGDASVGLSVLKGLGLLAGKQHVLGCESASTLRSQVATRELLELI